MTTTTQLPHNIQVVWPEHEDPNGMDYQYEHAIAVVPYTGSISLEQNGQCISIPVYALKYLLRAMRAAGDVAGEPT